MHQEKAVNVNTRNTICGSTNLTYLTVTRAVTFGITISGRLRLFNLDLFINDALLLDTLIVVEIVLYVILDYLID